MNNRSNKKLANNIMLSSAYQIMVMIVPVLTTPYVTRIFDVTLMGEYNLSLSIVSIFVVAAQFGLPSYGSREIAIAKTDLERQNIFFQLLTMQFFLSIFLFFLCNILFIGLANFSNKPLFFIQSLLILVNIFDFSWFFVGIEEIGKTVLRNAFTKIFTTLTIFVLIKSEKQINIYALINVLGMLLGNLTMVASISNYINLKAIRFYSDKKHIINSFKLLLPRLFTTSYDSAERNILNLATSASNVGVFSEAKKIINLAFSVINAAFSALSPRMSYHASRGENDKVSYYFEKGLYNSTLFSVIIVSGILTVAPEFVDFFYGDGYEAVTNVLRMLALSLAIIPIISLINNGILIPLKKDKNYLVSILIIVIFGIIFNLILDPYLGAVGAATSYLLSQLLSLIYLGFICRKIIRPLQILSFIILTFFLIISNTFLINLFSQCLTIENSIISFIIKGFLSVSISIILFWGAMYLIKINKIF